MLGLIWKSYKKLCAYAIEQHQPIRQEIREKIEVAYQNRNLKELEAIRSEVQQSEVHLSTQTVSRESVLSKFDDWRYDRYSGMAVPGD